jgi:hypothetical protein
LERRISEQDLVQEKSRYVCQSRSDQTGATQPIAGIKGWAAVNNLLQWLQNDGILKMGPKHRRDSPEFVLCKDASTETTKDSYFDEVSILQILGNTMGPSVSVETTTDMELQQGELFDINAAFQC